MSTLSFFIPFYTSSGTQYAGDGSSGVSSAGQGSVAVIMSGDGTSGGPTAGEGFVDGTEAAKTGRSRTSRLFTGWFYDEPIEDITFSPKLPEPKPKPAPLAVVEPKPAPRRKVSGVAALMATTDLTPQFRPVRAKNSADALVSMAKTPKMAAPERFKKPKLFIDWDDEADIEMLLLAA